MNRSLRALAMVLGILGLVSTSHARAASTATKLGESSALTPNYYLAEHNQGGLTLAVTNHGSFGSGFSDLTLDSFTGLAVKSLAYPKESESLYLFGGGLWIGAVIGNDTLVSVGVDGWQFSREFHPEEGIAGAMIHRSTLDTIFDTAVSEEDFISVYYDTCTTCPYNATDYLDSRTHLPIGLEVTEASYGWSHKAAEDFVLFEVNIKNVSANTINDMYVGLYLDGDVHGIDDYLGATDDLAGMRRVPSWPDNGGCYTPGDSHYVAWTADNNGEFASEYGEVLHVAGFTWLGSPAEDPTRSFNWWISNTDASQDFGPMRKAAVRDFQTGGLGTPEGDRNKYFVLSNGDIDYNQPYVSVISATDTSWLPPPPQYADDWAWGADVRSLLSYGPLDLEPGQSVPLAFACVAGSNLHTSPQNVFNLPNDPQSYMEGLDFRDLESNTRWASWVYDNPGVDTDSDGYFGEYVVCGEDTVWVGGDGVPDFHDPSYVYPLPDGSFRVEPLVGGLQLRWNGLASETMRDVFSRQVDFEGYHVYFGYDAKSLTFINIARYDIQNYVKYIWSDVGSDWLVQDNPFTPDSLRSLYGQGDPQWDPEAYPKTNPFVWSQAGVDSIFYFAPFLTNNDQLGIETPITKLYPNAPKPATTDPDDIDPDSVSIYLTDDGFFKYYEYELLIENLLPTMEYTVFVTALDHGSVRYGLGAGESPLLVGAVTLFPDSPTDTPEDPIDLLPDHFALAQNYPNPFNPSTDISFSIPAASQVRLDIINIAGQTVETLVDDFLSAGEHTAHWSASGRASGVYLYRLTAGEFTSTRKMILVK